MFTTVGKPFRRAMHFDFHTPPGIPNIFKNFHAEAFADQLKEAHIEYINFTARCNMGYSYYQTKVGRIYEGLGERDVLAEVLEACHKRNIGVSAYINVGLNHEFAALHTDWLRVDQQGRIYQENKKDNFFRVMCYRSDYRRHLLAEIREIAAYDIDGLFCDCLRVSPCYCPQCMADMKSRGYDVTVKSDAERYQKQIAYELCLEIRNAIPKKGLKFYFNGMNWTYDIDTHTEVECLPTGKHWGYDVFPTLSAFARPLYEDRVYMTGRFQNSWGDFGGLKPLASMQNDLYDAMMNSFGFCIGDHLHPIDGFEHEVAKRVSTVMAEKMRYEPYTDAADNVVEVGILVRGGTRKLPSYIKGMGRMLKEMKLLYNIYDGRTSLDGLKLLIIGEDIEPDEEYQAAIRRFADKGGKLIFTGSAMDLAQRLGLSQAVELIGEDTRDNAYYTVNGSDMRWAMYYPSRLMRCCGGTALATYVDHHFNFIWDGHQSYYYRPQGMPTDLCATMVDGSLGYVCFDIFEAYAENMMKEHRDLLEQIVNHLLPDRLISANALPRYTTVALTKHPSHLILHVKATYPEIKMERGIIEEHLYMPSAPLSVKGEYKVYLLPELTPVDAKVVDGRTTWQTGDIVGYRAFLLKT